MSRAWTTLPDTCPLTVLVTELSIWASCGCTSRRVQAVVAFDLGGWVGQDSRRAHDVAVVRPGGDIPGSGRRLAVEGDRDPDRSGSVDRVAGSAPARRPGRLPGGGRRYPRGRVPGPAEGPRGRPVYPVASRGGAVAAVGLVTGVDRGPVAV